MLRIYLVTFVWITMGIFNVSVAQNDAHFKAKTYLKYKDYYRALNEYLQLYANDKTNSEINFNIGLCYLNINEDKSKAIPYLEFVLNKGEKYNSKLLLYLGMGYMYAYKFDEAIKYYKQYQENAKGDGQDIAESYIKNCENAKILMKNPVNVTFENLGNLINTPYPEYFPFVTRDQKTLYFTTTREKNVRKRKSSLGFYTSDIYFSNSSNKKWGKAESIGNIVNTIEDEQCSYVSPNGKNMVISIDNEESFGDIFISTTGKKGQFSKPTPFSPPVNTKRIELEGCIFEDGKTMIASSNRRRGMGEMDLYIFKKLPDGNWDKGTNLGPSINTEFKEAFPVYDEKKGVLYFASQGHINIGGFDIFKSKYDSVTQTFEPAINLGYPINTPEDNFQISIAGNECEAFISAYRKEGLGDLDIYKITFNDIKCKTDIDALDDDGMPTRVKVRDSIVYVYIHDTVFVNKNPDGSINNKQLPNNKLVYRIQIGFYQNPIEKDVVFKGLDSVYIEPVSGGTKYFTGSYPDFATAQNAIDYMISLGHADAFIVAYYNEKRITIEEARAHE